MVLWFLWHLGVKVITTAQLHSTTRSELRFCAGSNPACGILENCNSENLWQWSRLEIRCKHLSLVNHSKKAIHHHHHLHEPILFSSKEEILLVLLIYQDPMLFLSPAYLAAFLFGLRISALFIGLWISIPVPIQALALELQICSYCLNIGQSQLNIALIM